MSLQTTLEAAVERMIPFMLDSVTFSRPTVSTDTSGGHTASYATVASEVPCAVAPAKRHDYKLIVGEQPIAGSLYAIVCPAKSGSSVIDVDTSCSAVVAARAGQAARTYKVQWLGRASVAAIKLLVTFEE